MTSQQLRCTKTKDGYHVWKIVFIDCYSEVRKCKKCGISKGETF